ncbi:MAG: spermidine synthase, partial [Cyanobacteriota bacterium]
MYNQNKIILIILTIAFFFSGASALIYQVLWVKQLTLTFGSTTLAISTILACFMSGLALGSYLMGKYAKIIKRPVFIYALIEILIGIYALILPILFVFTDDIYKYLWPLTGGTYFYIAIIRFLLVFLILIIPTTLMGATLPLLVKYYINKDELIV